MGTLFQESCKSCFKC